MTNTSDSPALLDLQPPPPRHHGFLTAWKTMRVEIQELRNFIAGVLPSAIPERYAELEGQIGDLEAERAQLKESRQSEERELRELQLERSDLQEKVVALRDEAILQEVGVYDYNHPMETSAEFKNALKDLKNRIKSSARDGRAASTTADKWLVNGSETQGRKMVRDMSKLLLRAYNNEADTLVDKLAHSSSTRRFRDWRNPKLPSIDWEPSQWESRSPMSITIFASRSSS